MSSIFSKDKQLIFAVVALLASPLVTLAESSNYFKNIIDRLLDKIVWPVFIGLVVIMFIWAGVLFLTAQGDPSKISQARKALVWAVIGVGVGFLAFSFMGLIKGIIGA